MAQMRVSRRSVLGGIAAGLAGAAGLGEIAAAAPTEPRWLSGVGDPVVANVVDGGFGRWRGAPCTYARIWADASLRDMGEIWGLDRYTAGGWTGTLDIACGGPRDGLSWRDAAEGRMDAIWTRQCSRIREGWGQLDSVHLSMAHELNGNWYPWSVTAGDVGDFRRAWGRWYGIVQRELVAKGKRAKVCLNLNADTVPGVSVRALLPDAATFDVLGCNFYSMWPDLRTQADWDAQKRTTKGDGSPRGLEAWHSFAASIGKPLSFPEWGVNPQSHSDNPFFVQQMNAFFTSHAPQDARDPAPGEIAGEAYFNTWATCQLWPTSEVPGSAGRYRALRWGS